MRRVIGIRLPIFKKPYNGIQTRVKEGGRIYPLFVFLKMDYIIKEMLKNDKIPAYGVSLNQIVTYSGWIFRLFKHRWQTCAFYFP